MKTPILQKFVDLCGGQKANIAVIPTASKLGQTGSNYMGYFEELGPGTVSIASSQGQG